MTIRIVKGDDVTISIPVSGVQSFTGLSAAKFVAKPISGTGDEIIKTLGSGVSVTGATINIELSKDDTDVDTDNDNYEYEVEIIDADGKVRTVRDRNSQTFKIKFMDDLD